MRESNRLIRESRTTGIEVLARIALGLMALGAGVAMLGPFQHLEQRLSLTDKQAHFLVFYFFTVLGLVAAPRIRRTDIAWTAIYLGWAIEVAQAVTGRGIDFTDAAADTFGVVAAMIPLYVGDLRSQARGKFRRRRQDRRLAHAHRAQPSRERESRERATP